MYYFQSKGIEHFIKTFKVRLANSIIKGTLRLGIFGCFLSTQSQRLPGGTGV